jgi:two-component system sensor kinase FixL
LSFELRHAQLALDLRLAASSPVVLADDIQIQQVLVNLITNAIQAMETFPFSERRLIIQSGIAGDGFVQVSITDSGKGVSPEHFDRLFEPFFTTKPQGLGVGLNLSRSIVANHGGRMHASLNAAGHNPAGGMCFTFALPPESFRESLRQSPQKVPPVHHTSGNKS